MVINGYQFLSDSEIIEKLNNVSKNEVEVAKEPDEVIDIPSVTEHFTL